MLYIVLQYYPILRIQCMKKNSSLWKEKALLYYTLYFGLVLPAMKSAAWAIAGKSKILPITGICRPTESTVGKKFPKRFKNPNPSRAKPKRPHLNKTKTIPKKKQMVPRILSDLMAIFHFVKLKSELWNFFTHLEKSVKVLLKPIVKHNPKMKSVFPIAISLLDYI